VTVISTALASAISEEATRRASLVFDEVFRAEAPYVGRTLRYLGVAEAYVDDACQEVFVVVHLRLKDFVGGSLRAWVRRICILVARNHRRSMRRRREDVSSESPEPAIPPPQQRDLELHRLRDRLMSLLDELSVEQRDAFVLYEIEQLTMSEVAEALGCPLQTAYSRLHAARATLADRLRRGA
jgi:RNA polymerase sigma-70 factor (ECF subfamily)